MVVGLEDRRGFHTARKIILHKKERLGSIPPEIKWAGAYNMEPALVSQSDFSQHAQWLNQTVVRVRPCTVPKSGFKPRKKSGDIV